MNDFHFRTAPSPHRLTAAAVLIATLAPAGLAVAQGKTYCSEPVTPFCANRPGVFEDERSRDRCGDEVDAYVEEMRAYVDCLGTQQDEVRARIELIENRFACMAGGGNDCP